MGRLNKYLNERKSLYGDGISFIDIDETLFKTFAKILVKDKNTGEVVRELDNQEFNSYELGPDEEYDFQQFQDAKLFRKTSVPIDRTVNRIKRMISMIKKNNRNSKIIFLTARSDFDDKEELLQAFRDQGIDVDFLSNVYIERTGNIKQGTVPEKKKKVILNYLKEGHFRRVRMIDDHKGNLKTFLSIAEEIPQDIVDKVRKNTNIPEGSDEPVMEFYSLHVDENGKLSLYGKEEVK